MVISVKDSFKFIGITIVMFSAVFVCTFFLNFYIDAKSIENLVTSPEMQTLYNAQMATAKFTCGISGGFLGLIAAVMLVFYIKLYIDNHAKQLGILKAMGYSEWKIAVRFAVFGLSVLSGTAIGFAGGFMIMPTVYRGLSIAGLPEIAIKFHPSLLVLLVFMPAVVFAALAVVFAALALRCPVGELLRGKAEKAGKKRSAKPTKSNKAQTEKKKKRSFLKEMCLKTLFGKKTLAFFVAFACFCFSAMVQMGASMHTLTSDTMGYIIFIIGVVLAVTTIFMAITSLVKSNVKNIAIMKAFGYSMKEYALSLLGGYHIFAFLGFALGTVYQYGLLCIMINIVFKDVENVPEYNFNVPVLFITLAAFIVLYEAVMIFYAYRMKKISVKEVMAEN